MAKKSKRQKLIDYQTKKSVHINLVKSSHAEFRIELFRRGLSMQEVFNRLVSMVCAQDKYLIDVLDTMEIEKREQEINQVSSSDAKSVYEIIEAENPFNSDRSD